MNKYAKGALGETVAKSYLVANGYDVIAVNYRTNLGEIDLVALDAGVLVFVEVKARGSAKYGYPAEAVSVFKQRKISMVAAQYIKQFRLFNARMRFDVIEIIGDQINHIKSAFDSYLRY